jgi:hypothetical protein
MCHGGERDPVRYAQLGEHVPEMDVHGGLPAGVPVLAVTLALTAVALVAGEMLVGRLTGRPVLCLGLGQLAFGGLAIAVIYLVGHPIGSHGADGADCLQPRTIFPAVACLPRRHHGRRSPG